MEVGDPIDWLSKITLCLSGAFLLIALSTQMPPSKEERSLSEKWAIAFRGGRTQITTFFSEMLNGFSYNRIVVEHGKPVDYVFLEINFAFEKMTGLKAKKIIGKKATEVFENNRASVSDWMEIYGRVALKGESVKFESYSKPLDKWFTISAYCPEKGYFVALFEDITERKKVEGELDKYQKHLEKLVDEKTKQLMDSERLAAIGETAGMVGHDLRNPLQSIVGEVFLAENELKSVPEGDSKRSLRESIRCISEQAGYMDKIVSDLQTFVRPVEALKQIVDLKEFLSALLPQIGIPENVQTAVQVQEALTVVADPQLLKRVLINLLTNAVQAMPKGGKITIRAQAAGIGQVEISVADTGVGIPDDVKPKLFTPLFTTKSRGQGFGLAVCKRVIEAQGGTISFESQVGKGTTFIIHLPTAK